MQKGALASTLWTHFFRLTCGGVSTGRGVEVLLAGVETASWGCAGTCRYKASVMVHGHMHLINELQDQGPISCVA